MARQRNEYASAVIGDLPRTERCLAWFAVAAFLFTAIGLWAGSTDRAYAEYYHNPVIRTIQLGASGVDLGVLLSIACWRRARPPQWPITIALTILALAGTWLTWFELWYGSTFYYGEVRDKQGLPYNINNFGVLGGFVFLAYLIWRLPPGRAQGSWSVAVRCALTMLLLLGQGAVLGMIGRLWNLE
jgi:hypothetical protein